MKNKYTIVHTDKQDGPHDLLSIMRKIRAGKITQETLLIKSSHNVPQHARELSELAAIFSETLHSKNDHEKIRAGKYFKQSIQNALHFIGNNSVILSGGGLIVIVIAILFWILSAIAPIEIALVITFLVYMCLQSVFSILALRLYRGQNFTGNFLVENLFKNFSIVIVGSLYIGTIAILGLLLFVIPGLIVLSCGAFFAFIIADNPKRLVHSIENTIKLATNNTEFFGAAFGLVTLNLICLPILIIAPLTIPLFTLALADLYNESGA